MRADKPKGPAFNTNPGGKGYRAQYKDRPMNVGPVARQRPMHSMLGFQAPTGMRHGDEEWMSSRVAADAVLPALAPMSTSDANNAGAEAMLDTWMQVSE